MRLLVTGGSGFTGRRVVARARAEGHHVTGLARSAAAADVLGQLGADVVRGDLAEAATVESAFRDAKADALLNLASLGFGHADTVVAATTGAGIQRAVFVSTTAIFTRLDAPSKQVRTRAEAAVQGSGLAWTIVRPTMIYGGPDDRNMCRLLRSLRRFPVALLPDGGRRLQQPIHVDDLAAVLLAAVATDAAVGKCYDVAGPDPLPFRQVVRTAGDAVGRRVLCVPVPVAAAIAAVGWYERRSRRPRVHAEQIARLAEDKAFDIGAAVRDLAFAPRPFAEGIRAEAATLR